MRLTYWAAFWVFILDQISKWWVVHWLDLFNRQRIDVAPPFLTFQMAWNRGINFGIGAGFDMRWVLIAVALGISGFVLWWVRKTGGSKWVYLSAGVLIGGAMGNVIDRILYGAVADFLNMSCCGINNRFSFNLADVSVFVGAVGLVFFARDDNNSKTRRPPKPRRNKTP